MREERFNEILGIILFFVSVFLLFSFVSYHPDDISYLTSDPARPVQNAAGLIGAYIGFGVFFTFGYCGYLIPVVCFFWAVCMFIQKVPEKLIPKLLGFIGMQLSLCCMLSLLSTPEFQIQMGGIVGYASSQFLYQYFGFSGTLIYSVFFILVSFLLATEFLLYEIAVGAVDHVKNIYGIAYEFVMSKMESSEPKIKKPKKINVKTAQTEEAIKQVFEDTPLKIKKYEDAVKRKPATKTIEDELEEEYDEEEEEPEDEYEEAEYEEEVDEDEVGEDDDELEEDEEYEEEDEDELDEEEYEDDEEDEDQIAAESEEGKEDFEEDEDEEEEKVSFKFVSVGANLDEEALEKPDLEFLNDTVIEETMNEDLLANSRLIESRLKDFNIEVKVTEVEQGPVITRYEIMPAPGIKLSRIVGLQDDIALTMKTNSIRIAPVPGKSTIGIEVPNSVKNMVYLKELIETRTEKSKKMALPLFFGKNTSGSPLISDLSEMPHLLIAGTTGSGKTVCLNAVIIGLLYELPPTELRMVMIDPKMVELAVYNDIPHLAAPVVTDAKKAASVLNWVVMEMENRYKLLASVGVRNIKSYNEQKRTKAEKEDNCPDKLPYIVVVVDELADLMMVASDKIESTIARLAQLSRAVGIHLILATQRPSVDVITGVIKANFPSRISFKVASKIDSRTVLDMMGAEKLLGKGDMLFLEPGNPKPIRSQSAFISDQEIRDITEYLKDQAEPNYLKELKDISTGKVEPHLMEKDEMYDQAVKVILECNQASVSVLQRKLRLGYARAARIIDMMESQGIVGPYQGSKPREILISRQQV